MQNRIRDIRKIKSLSQSQLGERVGLQKWDISRLESGDTPLKLEIAKKIAEALDAPLADILGIQEIAGLREDAEPYVADRSDPLYRLAGGANQSLFQIRTNVLDELGIRSGDVVLLDIDQKAVTAVKPLSPVVVQVYDPQNMMRATTLVRQFVPPNLLVTNSRHDNAEPINMAASDAHIKGVIVSWHRSVVGGKFS